ncbi:Cytochrome b-c1 complex subunit 7, mitochondrial [Friedmanniomyces endolithicus]|uniref:Complex III subunit 7 n=2 Tax=Dothideomycetidae TaxID=451867 RepID=A0A4U0VHZ5_9PEZI|nr:Cytochrome b-c1 complex subunit 7 [Friedmanniomyces endolithicus]KAK5145599.1 Cytochrome b-c1 complex subunit 7, mitochondrial [Rachicladosporium monterosium]KAK0284128.1 Cytochrome b-c1 complex subunit 7 [Friedmanniomyces endolithicus]KAK0300634.1 Cytochrome b-c1 complex subunit 7 [Friedmanniomyces endolithicus]KAK0328320.1 Cytochrome b-c1 complex subunit 7 [Friedmanniomyces endolithicus]
MSYPTLAPFIQQRPWLMRWMRPLARWYFDNSGYRKLGLRADDLIPEESESVQLALKRLPPKEAYDRVFRMRRAFQCSLAHQLLPQTEWTKADEDISYLEPIIKEIEAERTEREDLESMIIKKRTSASTKGGH